MIIRFPQNIWLHNKYNTLRLFDSSYFPVIFNTEVRKSNNTVFKNYYLKIHRSKELSRNILGVKEKSHLRIKLDKTQSTKR